jgi:Holliday junction DNA helicase RuvA
MIDFLRGKLVHREADYVVVDVNGIGYRVFCAQPLALQPDHEEQLTLFIHYNVREDAILLFGFTSREEQALFRKLLEVSGIGPRVALGVLSAGRPEAVVSAIYQEDVDFLVKLPGIGKKTAQRIILDLKDKLADLPMDPLTKSSSTAALPYAKLVSGGNAAWREAKLALMALGYTESETDRAWPLVQAKAGEGDSVDVLIKLALQIFYKG